MSVVEDVVSTGVFPLIGVVVGGYITTRSQTRERRENRRFQHLDAQRTTISDVLIASRIWHLAAFGFVLIALESKDGHTLAALPTTAEYGKKFDELKGSLVVAILASSNGTARDRLQLLQAATIEFPSLTGKVIPRDSTVSDADRKIAAGKALDFLRNVEKLIDALEVAAVEQLAEPEQSSSRPKFRHSRTAE